MVKNSQILKEIVIKCFTEYKSEGGELTQNVFADKVGISPSRFSKMLKLDKKEHPSFEEAQRVTIESNKKKYLGRYFEEGTGPNVEHYHKTFSIFLETEHKLNPRDINQQKELTLSKDTKEKFEDFISSMFSIPREVQKYVGLLLILGGFIGILIALQQKSIEKKINIILADLQAVQKKCNDN